MKKICMAMAFILSAFASATSQNTVFNNPDNSAYFGIRGGVDITCPGNVSIQNISADIFKNGGGFELGGIYNIPIKANFYIEPGLKLYYNTYSVRKEVLKKMAGVQRLTINKFGMRVPVMAGYHFDFTEDVKVSVFTGPELEIGLAAEGEIIGTQNYNEAAGMYGKERGLNRVNLLWSLGAGISYQHYYFGIAGHLGMLNMYNGEKFKFHENRVTFSLGYNF